MASDAPNKSPYKLNPLSDRYRVCPGCGKAHMTVHRGRDYCSDKCADDHYNNKRRLLKQAMSTITQNGNIVDTETNLVTKVIPEANPVLVENIKILDRVMEGKMHAVINPQDLYVQGFDPTVFSSRELFYLPDESTPRYCLMHGRYVTKLRADGKLEVNIIQTP